MNTSQPEQLYSIADIARELSLAESTCRYYCKRFAAYIPSIGQGRTKRYKQKTLEVLTVIADEMQKSHSVPLVEKELSARFPRDDRFTETSSSALGPMANLEERMRLTHNQAEASNDPMPSPYPPKAYPTPLQQGYARLIPQSYPYPQPVQPDPTFSHLALAFMERQTMAIEGIARMLNLLTLQLSQRQDLPMNGGANALDDLKKEVGRLALLLDANEKTQQADLEQLRKWMGRFLQSTGKSA